MVIARFNMVEQGLNLTSCQASEGQIGLVEVGVGVAAAHVKRTRCTSFGFESQMGGQVAVRGLGDSVCGQFSIDRDVESMLGILSRIIIVRSCGI